MRRTRSPRRRELKLLGELRKGAVEAGERGLQGHPRRDHLPGVRAGLDELPEEAMLLRLAAAEERRATPPLIGQDLGLQVGERGGRVGPKDQSGLEPVMCRRPGEKLLL